MLYGASFFLHLSGFICFNLQRISEIMKLSGSVSHYESKNMCIMSVGSGLTDLVSFYGDSL